MIYIYICGTIASRHLVAAGLVITTCVDNSFSVSFHAHVAFRSEEREDGCGPVDEGWNSCCREEKLPSKFREMTKKSVCYKQ